MYSLRWILVSFMLQCDEVMGESFAISADLLRSVALGAFLITQGFAITAFFVIRYHFRLFCAPGDLRGRAIVRTFGIGLIAIASGGGWWVVNLFNP